MRVSWLMSVTASLSIAFPCAFRSPLISAMSRLTSVISLFMPAISVFTSSKPSTIILASLSKVIFNFFTMPLVYHSYMQRKKLEKLVAEGYERLPAWVREKIKNVALLVEDEPSHEDREAEGLGEDETLLGLYKGVPLSERGELYGVGMTMPDTITLYQLPIEDAAEEELTTSNVVNDHNDIVSRYGELVAKIITETIWHEFAHHFGMDEHEVREREQKRDSK